MQTTAGTLSVTQMCGHVTALGPRDRHRAGWHKCHNCEACEAAAQAERARVHAEGTLCYLRYGKPPGSGYSRNGATCGTEAGVSAYPAYRIGDRYIMDLDDCELSAIWLADRPVYVITGTLLDARGSDGEPLLTGVKARKLPASATVEWLA